MLIPVRVGDPSRYTNVDKTHDVMIRCSFPYDSTTAVKVDTPQHFTLQ